MASRRRPQEEGDRGEAGAHRGLRTHREADDDPAADGEGETLVAVAAAADVDAASFDAFVAPWRLHRREEVGGAHETMGPLGRRRRSYWPRRHHTEPS